MKDRQVSISKRSFLMQAAATTCVFSYPDSLFAQPRADTASLVSPMEKNELYRVFWNYHATTNASPQERRAQFDTLVRLSAVTMDPGWKTRSASSKRSALQGDSFAGMSAAKIKWLMSLRGIA